MDESSQAAIFDFDGILFRKGSRWKIVNARIGMSGSLLNCDQGYKIFENLLLSNPDTKLSDYFIIEEYLPDRFPANGSVDITPIENLIKTAENHRFRGRDIYIMSSVNFQHFYFIVERIFSKYRQYPSQANPFDSCNGIISLSDTSDGVFNINTERDSANKLNFLEKMLRSREDSQDAGGPEIQDGRRIALYEKIFYYHTQSEQVSILENFINMKKDSFLDGKNALIPSYITNMNAIAVSSK